MKQGLRIVMFIGLYYPFVFIFLFYSFVARAIAKLGRLPGYDHPDPKTLNFDLHRTLISGSGSLLPVSIVILVAGLLVFFFRRSLLPIKSIHFLISASLLFIVLLTFISPLMEWFGD